jgi:hypothetical protein
MNRIKCLLLILIICFNINGFASHKVYVLHGWGNPKTLMNKIHRDIIKAGFEAENYAYPGLYEDLDTIAKKLYLDIMKENLDSVSFVTHSMGGLVVRAMLKYSAPDLSFPKIFRIVMIAPPNRGADIADFFKDAKSLKKLLGPNVEKMETDSSSYANQLPIPCNTEIGVIVGRRHKDKGYNLLIEGDNDGLISPENTLLGNEKDVAYVKYNHLGVIRRKQPIKLVVEFLKFGKFVSI